MVRKLLAVLAALGLILALGSLRPRAHYGPALAHAEAALPSALTISATSVAPELGPQCVPLPGGFPVTPGAYQTCPGGGVDGFITVFDLSQAPLAARTAPEVNATAAQSGCVHVCQEAFKAQLMACGRDQSCRMAAIDAMQACKARCPSGGQAP